MRQIATSKTVSDGNAVGRIHRLREGHYTAEIGLGSYLLTVRSREDLESLARVAQDLLPFAGVLPTVEPGEKGEADGQDD